MTIRRGDHPLASLTTGGTLPLDRSCSETSCPATRPLVLRGVRPARARDVPEYVYDVCRQLATTPDGRPLGPTLAKEWTSYDSTHTDGDGGDNETWGWEESTPPS